MTERIVTETINAGRRQAWLEIVIRGIKEGVVICDADATILLYNPMAKRLFRNSMALKQGLSLYGLCSRVPIEQTLNYLRQHRSQNEKSSLPEADMRFVCAAVGDGALLHCRLYLLAPDTGLKPAFIIFFDPNNQQGRLSEYRGWSLRSKVEELRGSLANLRAAAENLVTHPDMAAVMRSAFEGVVAQESVFLSEKVEALAEESRSLAISKQKFVADIFSTDLIEGLKRRLEEKNGPAVLTTGKPLWLKADSYLLLKILEYFVHRINKLYSVPEIEIEPLAGEHCVYLDILWKGRPVPVAEIEIWRREPVSAGDVSDLTVARILELHNSDVWSQEHEREGWARIRIPMPASSR